MGITLCRWGIGYRMPDGEIHIHESLFAPGKEDLFWEVYRHESAHSEENSFVIELLMDINPHVTRKLRWHTLTHPSMWWGFTPIRPHEGHWYVSHEACAIWLVIFLLALGAFVTWFVTMLWTGGLAARVT
jgi:hypothetical protein